MLTHRDFRRVLNLLSVWRTTTSPHSCVHKRSSQNSNRTAKPSYETTEYAAHRFTDFRRHSSFARFLVLPGGRREAQVAQRTRKTSRSARREFGRQRRALLGSGIGP